MLLPSMKVKVKYNAHGALARCYLNAENTNQAEKITKDRLLKMGWTIEYLEKSELFSMQNFDPSDHTPTVIQKGMDGKVAVDIEFW
jgi:hypothetical protein